MRNNRSISVSFNKSTTPGLTYVDLVSREVLLHESFTVTGVLVLWKVPVILSP